MNSSFPKDCYVVLHIGSGPSVSQDKSYPIVVRDSAPRFELGNDTLIERLDEDLAKNIQKACEPAHYNVNSVADDRHLYAFVRPVPAVEKTRYEGMADLHSVIALSRLVYPTSTGDRYSARVFNLKAATRMYKRFNSKAVRTYSWEPTIETCPP